MTAKKINAPEGLAAMNVHQVVRSIADRLPPRSRVLDVPTGTGLLMNHLQRQEHTAFGGDFLPEIFELEPGRFVQLDLNVNLPFRDHSFDAIFCIEGIEHIENPHHLVRECVRVLNPGGKLVISTPNIQNLKSRLLYFLFGTHNFFSHPLEVNPQNAIEFIHLHISPIDFRVLNYIFKKNELTLQKIHTNRHSPNTRHKALFFKWFGRLLRNLGRLRSHKIQHWQVKDVPPDIWWSDEMLLGEILIFELQVK